jgi:hypothetical protein
MVGAAGVAVAMLALLAGGVRGAAVWPVAALTGAALVSWNGAFHALVADRAGRGGIGRLSGEMMAVVFGGSVCLPPLLGFLSEELDSWTLLWAIAAAVVALAAGGLWLGTRAPSPATALAAGSLDGGNL